MWDANTEDVDQCTIKYHVRKDGAGITYAAALQLMTCDAAFRNFLTKLLAESPFVAYRWETPPVALATSKRDFEFVLIDYPQFAKRRTDELTFQDFFTTDDSHQGIVAFASLGKDATLIVPSPRTSSDAYGHLAAFLRKAPTVQADALWQAIGKIMIQQMNASPRWLNTAGGGVAWLHVRVDSTPKYYAYGPYRNRDY
jgi:hypothetical protein